MGGSERGSWRSESSDGEWFHCASQVVRPPYGARKRGSNWAYYSGHLRCCGDVSVLWGSGRDGLGLVGHLELSVVFRIFISHDALGLIIYGYTVVYRIVMVFAFWCLKQLYMSFSSPSALLFGIFLISWRLLEYEAKNCEHVKTPILPTNKPQTTRVPE